MQFTMGADKTVSEADTKSAAWLDGDTELDRTAAVGCGNAGGEEQRMFDKAATDFKLSSTFKAFYVETFKPTTSGVAYSIPPYCATGADAGNVNHLVIRNGAFDDTLAHELGHILIDSGDHHGIDNPADKNNLMFAPGRTGSDLDASQCTIISNNA